MSKPYKFAVGDYVMLWGKEAARIVELYNEDCEPANEHWYNIEFAEINKYSGITHIGGQPESDLFAGSEADFNKQRNASIDITINRLNKKIEKIRQMYID